MIWYMTYNIPQLYVYLKENTQFRTEKELNLKYS